MRYTIKALEQDPDLRGAYRVVSTESTPNANAARDAIRRAYYRTGVIPAVFDDAGREIYLYTETEVANWGYLKPDIF